MLNLRLLAGRFQENWVLVENHWPGLETAYWPMLRDGARRASHVLRRKGVEKRRLHDPQQDRVPLGLQVHQEDVQPDSDEPKMVEYIGQALGDTLFFGSEVTHYAALRDLTGEADDVAAFGAVMDDLRTLQNLFLTFVPAFVAVFATRNLASHYGVIRSHKHSLTDLRPLNDYCIPFFANFSANAAAAEAAKSAGANGIKGSVEGD